MELRADVIVVGFGAAGACAAIEAADAGADVLVLDRFAGGGATAVSGGVVYAGGGTAEQRACGIGDTPEAMLAYLRMEVGDVVADATLRRFCEGSAGMLDWLRGHGVPFEASLCPEKTSYPGNRHYLYYSGSEASGGFRDAAPPAPRGHRAHGRGTSGKVLFAALAAAVRARARVMPATRLTGLLTGPDGAVTGVVASTLAGAPAPVRAAHRYYARYAAKPGLYVPALRKTLRRRVESLERRYGKRIEITARRGVVLATGGFVADRELMRQHAPAYRGGLPLGTIADDGTAIRMGAQVGAATGELGRVSAWRFLTPPAAFLGGVLVDADGRRIIDESRYGAAIGEAMVTRHGGRGWLLVDSATLARARHHERGHTQWFQRLQAGYLLRGRATGATLAEVATKAGVDPDGLGATVAAHNAAAAAGEPDPAGKPAEFVRALENPPYALIDLSIKPSIGYPCPMLTLGGLAVDEDTGQVRAAGGGLVPGLYAAGRAAVGICSRSYVSGLSLADCVFSGRRAGENSALALGELDKNENVF
ncbi:FAD-binding protein [Amycolatopsis suaedae]|uniref:FAD-binding protein n=1 Tax=Amycolatopsis suaedae TaxID=2510978 RepID=A0A4Q7J9P0_9PSEU|nr:FAD-binding protein [Amycolatopsis suaedae]RZQ63143.1 FAD-binding protein [Amycolatopsis suaedae]